MGDFTLAADTIALPKGGYARTHRQTLRWRGRELLGLTDGLYRPYIYPLYSPAGFAVTTECPADHPHHNSIWVGLDHATMRMPAEGGRFEEYTYNFYVADVFQGRAPGRQVAVATETADEGGTFRIEQRVEWRGPAEWAAPDGRVVFAELRRIVVRPGERHHVLDIVSQLTPAMHDVAVGPTRHAYFNVRVAESMRVLSGGRIERGALDRWADYTGPVGGGHRAGVALMPSPAASGWWFLSEWGVMTVSPYREEAKLLRKGETVELAARYVVHDGEAPLAALYKDAFG